MKFNKLLLGAALVTPLFLGSCDPGIKIKGLTVEGVDLLYACSQERSVNISFASGTKCEFVDDFKESFIKWDSQTVKYKEGINIKSIKKTACNNIQVTFEGPYSGDPYESEYNLINFTIDKSAFKNNVVEEDAKGSLYVFADKVYLPSVSSGETGISFRMDFSRNMTGVTLAEFSSPAEDISITEYGGNPITNNEKIKFEYVDNESLDVTLSGLKDGVASTYQILIGNTDDLTLFNNLPKDYGFRIKVQTEGTPGSSYIVVDRFYGSYIYSVDD